MSTTRNDTDTMLVEVARAIGTHILAAAAQIGQERRRLSQPLVAKWPRSYGLIVLGGQPRPCVAGRARGAGLARSGRGRAGPQRYSGRGGRRRDRRCGSGAAHFAAQASLDAPKSRAMSAADQDIRTALLDAARALGPMIRSAADQIEQERRLPQPLVEAMAEAGLFKMLVPARHWAAAKSPPRRACASSRRWRGADGSAGWCVMLPACCGVAAGSLSETVAREIWGRDRRAYVVGSARLGGRAVTVADGYRVSGRWAFASGCQHATWLLARARCTTATPRARTRTGRRRPAARVPPGGRLPDHRHVARHRPAWQWQPRLRGRGGLRAPRAVAPALHLPAAASPGPLYAFGVGVVPSACRDRGRHQPWAAFGAPGFAAISLGIARGALDAFTELAGSKAPRGGKALLREDAGRPGSGRPGRGDPSGCPRLHCTETVRESWETVVRTRRQHGRAADRAAPGEHARRGPVRPGASKRSGSGRRVVDLPQQSAGAPLPRRAGRGAERRRQPRVLTASPGGSVLASAGR